MELPASCSHIDCLSFENRKAILSKVQIPRGKDIRIGQYQGYTDHVLDDRSDKKDSSISKVPTFASVSLKIDSDRWRNTKFTMVAGKGLKSREAYVRVTFKSTGANGKPESVLFNIQGGLLGENVIEINGTGGVLGSKGALSMKDWDFKDLGNGIFRLKPMDYVSTPPAYEVVMRGGIWGDRSLFVDTAELLLLWKVCIHFLVLCVGLFIQKVFFKLFNIQIDMDSIAVRYRIHNTFYVSNWD
jgi:glucose-6-phosphate 1-dehydrogenase